MQKKYLVETISVFRMRYVVEADCAEHAKDEVTMNMGDLAELSQYHLDEMISSTREIDTAEYLRMFDEDNDYLKDWSDEHKLGWINKIEYVKDTKANETELKELDPDQRDWEYDGCGSKVWKGTMEPYND
jgi:hypothetical protein